MKISPEIEKIYKNYFDSLGEKKKLIERAKKVGQLWLVGDIGFVDGNSDNKGTKIQSNSDTSVIKIISEINELVACGIEAIEMSICSSGGLVSAGFTIFDYLRTLDMPIITIAYGDVCSMAVDLFEMGVIRKMTAGSMLMMHHVQSGAEGTPEKMALEASVSKYYDKLTFILTSMRSDIPLKKLEKMTYPLKYFTPEEAVKMNLADEIV